MGHASPATTSAYVHHSRADLEKAAVAPERGPSVLELDAQRRHRQARQ
jgi:hypothetical protein